MAQLHPVRGVPFGIQMKTNKHTKNEFLLPRLVLNVTGSLLAAHTGSHSITTEWTTRNKIYFCMAESHVQKCCKVAYGRRNRTRTMFFFFSFLSPYFFFSKEHRSLPHFTSSNPFTHAGCCQATQLVTAWIILHEGLGQTIKLEIQFCATSNVRQDPSDAG